MTRNERIQKVVNEALGLEADLFEVKRLESGRWGFIADSSARTYVGAVALSSIASEGDDVMISVRGFDDDNHAIDMYEQLGVA